VNDVHQANRNLVDMELAALEFAKAGQSQEAVKTLESDYYWQQKAIYAGGLKGFQSKSDVGLSDTLILSNNIVSQALQRTNRLVNQSRIMVNVLVVITLGLGLVITFMVSRSISRPIEELEKSAIDISRGVLPEPINVRSSGEIKLLITAFNRMLGDLKDNRNQLSERSLMESLVESIKEGMIMLDRDGDIVIMNPQARRMLNIDSTARKSDQILKERLAIIGVDKMLERSIANSSLEKKEINLPENPNLTLLCSVCPVNARNKVLGTAIIFRDVSAEKEADEMKTEFISTVSHELRTPLAITKEGISLILDGIAGDVTKKQVNILNMAQDNIARLGRLINNLLDISKIEAGKMEVRNSRLEITSLTDKVINDFNLKVKEKGLDMRVNYLENDIEVYTDRDKVIQIFTNLINNAIKFTAEGFIEISGKPSGEFYQFTVADSGIGISETDLKRTFSKFQQFGRAAGKGEKGTGLGLSIAKGLVEMQGGRIWVESELGQGTKFHFTLRKYSDDLPFKEFVQNRVAESQRNAEHLSLVMINVKGTNGKSKPLQESIQKKFMKDIEHLISADLHREKDMTFSDAKRCAAAIANCDKNNVGQVCERIKGSMEQYLKRESLTGKVKFQLGCATYPDDARTGDDLVSKIRSV